MSHSLAIAAPSDLAVDAARDILAAGGNAVDAAVAAAVAAMCTEVGIVSLDAGAFVTVWPRGGEPRVVEGCVAMPGSARPEERFGRGGIPVRVAYGGGVDMVVGCGAVAVGGAVAALGETAGRWGALPWARILEPAASRVREGFPLSHASRTWLEYSHEAVFGWQKESHALVHDEAGNIREAGHSMHIPRLADTLELLGREGPGCLYGGELGRAIAERVDAGDGLLSLEDLAAYRARVCDPLEDTMGDWTVAMPPPPSLGGAALAAMMAMLGHEPQPEWSPEDVARLAEVQRAVFGFRNDHVFTADDPPAAVARLLAWARQEGEAIDRLRSPSTIHVSVVDAEGMGCAVTASSGYGSGVFVPSAGLWLNNCLGEIELNPRGFHALPPGRRLGSNMAPTVGRREDGAVLAVGSPGAERITTAILQVLINFTRLGMSLAEAIDAPRLHVERTADGWCAAAEPGLPLDALAMPHRCFEELSMFFGGVGAALVDGSGRLEAAADPRRRGSARVLGSGRA
ncbi:MAG: gamma-glutamyltransferase [Gammaproteobacteria bacterium]